MRKLNLIDHLLYHADTAFRTILPPKIRQSNRENPAHFEPESAMDLMEKNHVAGLMRVNHAGEVCAQALYQGQALTAKLDKVRAQMTAAALDEIDHLAWCEQRLEELNSQPSLLNPIWYAASYSLGAFAGLLGDALSLGFVAETERQVADHIQRHLKQLPLSDLKTKAILTQMHQDEAHHATVATHAGGAILPDFIQRLMKGASHLLTFGSYYI